VAKKGSLRTFANSEGKGYAARRGGPKRIFGLPGSKKGGRDLRKIERRAKSDARDPGIHDGKAPRKKTGKKESPKLIHHTEGEPSSTSRGRVLSLIAQKEIGKYGVGGNREWTNYQNI